MAKNKIESNEKSSRGLDGEMWMSGRDTLRVGGGRTEPTGSCSSVVRLTEKDKNSNLTKQRVKNTKRKKEAGAEQCSSAGGLPSRP